MKFSKFVKKKMNIWILMILFMVVGGIVSNQLKNKIKKYSKIPTTSGLER